MRAALASFVAANQTGPAFDYAKAFADARRQAYRLNIASRRQIIEVYQRAASEAAAIARDALERGLSELTAGRWQVMASRLAQAADEIARGTESTTKSVITLTTSLFAEVDKDYIWTAAKLAGANRRITEDGLGRIVARVSEKVVASLATRLWSDGYTFSQRVWGREGIREGWLDSIKMTVASGIAQGRDPAQIARDIQVYTAKGKDYLLKEWDIKTWGQLKKGTAEFAKRIPKNIDYRALRLVRSELGASLQDAELRSGQINPAATGEYDWVLSPAHLIEDSCDDLAAKGPYQEGKVPTYPHPNCFCSVRPRLMDHDEFVSDLANWASGANVPYLDKWETNVYRAAA